VKILVANLGSTSLKWRLFDFSNGHERLLHKGGFERVADYAKAIGDCLVQLKEGGHIQSESDLAAVGFKTIMARGVNGCQRLDENVVEAMEAFNELAPAHNPPYITGIRLFAQRMPAVPLVGLFETAFYQWAPAAAVRYAVPESWHALGVQRWGFHGASHKFIAERSAELLGRDDIAERARRLYVDAASAPVRKPDLRIISCHLGGSSSITGILNGIAKRLNIDPKKIVFTLAKHGNTSAASIPLALNQAFEDHRLADGRLVLMEAMGGGLTWGAALARW